MGVIVMLCCPALTSSLIVDVQLYREARDEASGTNVYFSPASLPTGTLHLTPLAGPYPPLGDLERRRLIARKSGTTFCLDFPMVPFLHFVLVDITQIYFIFLCCCESNGRQWIPITLLPIFRFFPMVPFSYFFLCTES